MFKTILNTRQVSKFANGGLGSKQAVRMLSLEAWPSVLEAPKFNYKLNNRYRPQGADGRPANEYLRGNIPSTPTPPPNILHVKASYNNTHICITNPQGDVLVHYSGGKAGYKKAQRAGHEPAYQATKQALDKAKLKLGTDANQIGLHVKFSGFGPGRDAAWKCVAAENWTVRVVQDITPIAHGGCRARKARRL